jgi:hypothetical protein
MNKEKIYYLLGAYTRGEYTVRTFCDVFEEVFYHEVDSKDLTPKEYIQRETARSIGDAR